MKNLLKNASISLVISAMMLSVYHFSGIGKKVIAIDNQTPTAEVSVSNNKLLNYAPSNSALSLPDFRTAAQKTMPAVVHIKSRKTNKRQNRNMYEDLFGWGWNNSQGDARVASTGSGVIVSPDGFIVTNNHVIENADELEVVMFDNRSYKAIVIGTDPSTDLGLIKIDDTNLPTVELANSDQASVGEWVLAVGNPFNLASTATAGIVSAIGRNLDIINDRMAIESFIQTDAAVNPGNSGGALVNLEGNLLGINTAIASPTGAYAGYAFAVPANIVSKVVEDLRTYGSVQRGFIGISRIINLTSEVAEELNLDITEGVMVQRLSEQSAARKAGLREGDVIVSIDGIQIKNDAKLTELVARNRPGDVVEVRVNRQGKYKKFNVRLTNQQGEVSIEADTRNELLNELGISFEDMDSNYLGKYGVENGVKISKLYAGAIRSQTSLKPGFIILSINGEKVYSSTQAIGALENGPRNVHVEGFYPGDRYVYEYEFKK